MEEEKIKEVLAQHGYEYKRFLGKGSFSSVFLCRSSKYQQDFAVKMTVKHKITELEYNTMVSLNHSNIIKLYDAFEDEKAQYLVMEYCPNGTLRQKGKLSYDQFIRYSKQILEALSYCHSKNVAHRDIKPDNIFLNEYDQVKLADFGLAKKFEIDSKSNEKCGSLMYLPPEMFLHRSICPFKADIWSLGITFFFMATGKFPYVCNSREDLKNLIAYDELNLDIFDIDPRIQFLIEKMTVKNLNLRSSPEELLQISIFSSNNTRRKYSGFRSFCGSNQNKSGPQKSLSRLNANSFRIIKPNLKSRRMDMITPPLTF